MMAAGHDAMADQLEVSFTTRPTPNGRYAPRNVVAVWVEDSNGNFVSTLMRFGSKRAKYLRAWNAVATDVSRIANMPDVITGATRRTHGTLTALWDLKDVNGFEVPDGSYTVRMELTDHNSSSASANNEGLVTFEKNGVSVEQTGMSNGNFDNISVFYVAGAVDTGGDPTGGSIDCTTVQECTPNDGCCLPDCVLEVDSDCDPATARTVAAGCSAGGPSHARTPLLLLAVIALLFHRARRRRGSSPRGSSSREHLRRTDPLATSLDHPAARAPQHDVVDGLHAKHDQ